MRKNTLLLLIIIKDLKIKSLKNIKLNALPVYVDRYVKAKIKTYGDKVYTDFDDLNVPEDVVEYKSLTIISINSLPVYEKKYYPQVYFDNCAYKIVNKQMLDYLDGNLFETDKDYFLINGTSTALQ